MSSLFPIHLPSNSLKNIPRDHTYKDVENDNHDTNDKVDDIDNDIDGEDAK